MHIYNYLEHFHLLMRVCAHTPKKKKNHFYNTPCISFFILDIMLEQYRFFCFFLFCFFLNKPNQLITNPFIPLTKTQYHTITTAKPNHYDLKPTPSLKTRATCNPSITTTHKLTNHCNLNPAWEHVRDVNTNHVSLR